MGRDKLIRLPVRLANSLSSNRQPGFHWLRLNQVTHFSSLTQSPPFSLFRIPHSFFISPISHQTLHFSSKPESSVELVLSNVWSEEIENELEKLNPKLTHEFVVFVLMKLNRNPEKRLQFFRWVRERKGFEPSYLAYRMLLRSLAGTEFMNDFWVIASEIKEKGFCIDRQIYVVISKVLQGKILDEEASKWSKFYNSFTGDVVEVIMGSDWSEEVESKLNQLKFPLRKNFLHKVIWKLKNEPLKALKFFEWLKRDQKYEHNSVTYNAMARVLSRKQLFDEFWDLLTRMRSEGYEIDSYVKIARFFKNEDGVKLFEFVMEGPYKLSERECTGLLRTLVNDPDPDIELITRVLKKYVEMGNTITKAMYSIIHESLCKVRKFDEAKKIVDHMRSLGYKLNDVTYRQEVFGLRKLGMLQDASLTINQMEAAGCSLNVETCTILIKRYCAAGKMDEALSSFTHMLDKKVEPHAAILRVLIGGFLSHNKLLDAYKNLVEMVNNAGVKPWRFTYKLMIKKLVQGGKLEEALVLLNMMKQHNYAPHPKPVGLYISKSGTVEDAKKLLEALSRKGGSPSTEAYVDVISYFLEEGRHSEAKDLLDSSPQHVHNQKKIQDLFGMAPISSPN